VSRCPDLHKKYVITFPDTEIADRPVGARRWHCGVEEEKKRQMYVERSKVYNMECLEHNVSDIHKNKFRNLLYLISKRFRLSLWYNHSPIPTVPKDVYLGVKGPEPNADHSLHLAPILIIRGAIFEFPHTPSCRA
jgi:hypothetical protein